MNRVFLLPLKTGLINCLTRYSDLEFLLVFTLSLTLCGCFLFCFFLITEIYVCDRSILSDFYLFFKIKSHAWILSYADKTFNFSNNAVQPVGCNPSPNLVIWCYLKLVLLYLATVMLYPCLLIYFQYMKNKFMWKNRISVRQISFWFYEVPVWLAERRAAQGSNP